MQLPSHLTSRPTLAIVGASTRAAASSALRAGFQPIAADLFADSDLRAIATATRISPYPEGLVDWLRAMEPPAWMYTGALENHQELVDQMAWIAPLWGNSGDVLQRVRSPWELAHVLRRADLLFPETRTSADGLPRDGSWLAKSYHGASGSGVREFGETGRQGGKETRRHSETTLTPESPCHVYQRKISGVPCAAVFAALDNTATFIGVTRQLVGEPWLGAHGFQYAGSIGSLPISAATRSTLERLGEALTQQFELSGLFGVDFILDGERVWTVEVNPRYTASVEICERATGISAIALHAASSPEAPGRTTASTRAATGTHGKAILFARRDVTISPAFAEASLAESLKQPWPTLADVSPAGTPVDAGRPVLTIFAEGRSVEEVEQRLKARVAEIEQQLYGGEVET